MILYLIFSRWIFEKFDGIRGIWHFQLRTFYSRWGTPLLIAQFVTDTLPSNMWLDGEVSTNWNQYSCVAFYVVRYGLEEVRGLVITRWRLAWYFLLSNMLEVFTTKLLQGSQYSAPWNSFRYMTFDCPNSDMRNKPYSQRYSFMLSNIPQGCLYYTIFYPN